MIDIYDFNHPFHGRAMAHLVEYTLLLQIYHD